MKSTINILSIIVLLTFIISCNKDNTAISNCGQEYYYYYDQKIFLNTTKEKITVGFVDSLSYIEMKNILNDFSFIEPLKEGEDIMVLKLAIPELKPDLTCEQIELGLLKLEADSNISYANLFLVSVNNNLHGITDAFIVRIKDSSQVAELHTLAVQTSTSIIKQNEFNWDQYHFSATKNSNGNALEMANYFHETGKFEYCVPSFIRWIEEF